MPTKIGTVDKSELINAALPTATKTYTVISHEYIIDTINDALTANGFTVKEEEYRCTLDAKVAHGVFMINYDDDPDLGLMYTFSNSYDKSLKFKAAIGAYSLVNGSYIVSETDNWKRKHTGKSDLETEELINEHIQNVHQYFDQLKEDKESMRNIDITRETFSGLIGELYMNDFLGTDQLSVIHKEDKVPTHNHVDDKYNLWTCYLQITNALRQTHPNKWMQHQCAVHLFFISRFDLATFDDEELTEEEIVMDSTEQQPVIDGILDGVETLQALPGFTPAAIVEEEEPEEYVDPAQLNIDDVINEVINEVEQSVISSDEEESPFMAEHPGHPEATIDANGKDIVKEETEADDLVFFTADDFPGKSIGDFLEIGNVYYEILSKDVLDDTDYWGCKELEVMEEEIPTATLELGGITAEVPIEVEEATEEETTEMLYGVYNGDIEITNAPINILVEEEDEEEDEEEVYVEVVEEVEAVVLPIVEEVNIDALPDIAPPTEIEILEQVEIPEAVNEEVMEELEVEVEPEATDIPEELGEDTSPVKQAIADELEEIYGDVPNFTYTLTDDQYNILLDSGETITLASAYIDAAV